MDRKGDVTTVRDHHPGREPHPVPLLEDYLAIARREPGALPAAALRTGSQGTRTLLAHAATGGAASLAQLLSAARGGSIAGRTRDSLDLAALLDLAKVVALQELLPGDRADGVALYDLALRLFGASAMPRAHQGLHAQLAYRTGKPAWAEILLDTYPEVPAHIEWDLRIDLANPSRKRAGQREMPSAQQERWFDAFKSLLPVPHPRLVQREGVAPFDRLAACGVRRIDAPQRVSVIVTAYRPGPELLTTVRSLVDQSWSNLEILLVDDGSPPEHQSVLRQCAELDGRVRLISLDINHGAYVARNVGLAAAAGEFVAFQDCGDWSHPRRLERQVRPLVKDPELQATATGRMCVTDHLAITRPGQDPRSLSTTSLVLRRDVVQQRIGYFDGVGRGAGTEYHERVMAALGTGAVRQEAGDVYTLVRRPGGARSRDGGRPDPALAAYRSAYHLWHERIRAGTACAYLPEHAMRRPFPAPRSIRRFSPSRGRPDRYDAIFLSDWRPYGETQQSMLEEIAALRRWGMRVGVAHVESLRFMTTPDQWLCRQVQRLINNGAVDQVLLTDDVEVALLVIRHPPVLQFATAEPCRIRAKQVLILASEPPFERDGADYSYAPLTCTGTARTMFSTEPRWCPGSPAVRDFLAAVLPPWALTPFDLPGVLDTERWWVERNRFRLDRPVIGRHCRDSPAAWPADRETLLAAYPDSPDIDVRIMGGAATARSVMGRESLPANWVVYDYEELGVRGFLSQLDYFVYFPHAGAVETLARSILEAMATGCVVVLPHRFSAVFGDGAVYCHPDEVRSVVEAFHADWTSYFGQSQRALARVGRFHSHDAYIDVISTIVTGLPR